MVNVRKLGVKIFVFYEILIKLNYVFSNFSFGDKVEYIKLDCMVFIVR